MAADAPPAADPSPRLVPLSLARLAGNGLFRFVYPFLGLVAADVALGEGAETLLIAGLAAGGILMPVASRWLLGEVDAPRRSTTAGLAMLFLGTLLLGGLAPSVAARAGALGAVVALVAMVVLGLAKPLLDVGSMTYVSARVPWGRRGRALSVMELTWAGGLLVLAPVGLLAGRIGWRPTLVLLGALSLSAIPLLRRWLAPDAETAALVPDPTVPRGGANPAPATPTAATPTDATPTESTPPSSERTDAERTAARTDAARTDAARTDALPTDAAPSDADRTAAARTAAARTDAARTDAGRTVAAPIDATSTDAARTDSTRIFLVVFALVFVALETTFGVVGLWLEDVRGVDAALLASLTAIGGVGELTGSLFTVAAADRIGKARTAMIGLLACAAGFAVLGTAGPLWLAIVGLVVGLFGTETAIVAGIPLASEVQPGRRGAFLARAVAWSSVARAVAGAGAALLLRRGGIIANTSVSVVAALVAVVLLVVLVRRDPRLRG